MIVHNAGHYFRGFLLILLWSLAIPLCSAESTATEAAIRVGVTASLTGELAAPGTDQLRGVKMWADDLNGRGALLGRRVEIVSYDDRSDPDATARLYERLITQDNVDFLIGPYSSGLTLVAAEVADRFKVPMVAAGAASSRIWTQGYRNVFGVDAPARNYMDLLIESAAGANLKTIALLYADADFTWEVADGVRGKAAEHGMRVVVDRRYQEGTVEFGEMVDEVARRNPDLLIGGTYLNDSIAIMRELKRQDYAPKAIAFTVGPALAEFGETLGSDADGVLGVVSWLRGTKPMAYDFSFRYKEKYGTNAGVHAAYGYGAGQVLEAAVRLANDSSRDAVREQLGAMKFRSLLGNYRVSATGQQRAKAIYVMQWQEGRRRLVLPRSLREGIIIYPFTAWSER